MILNIINIYRKHRNLNIQKPTMIGLPWVNYGKVVPRNTIYNIKIELLKQAFSIQT